MGIGRSLYIPGHELSEVVIEVGDGVTDVTVGSAVYGRMDFRRDGAEAE
jgi:NADPH:quinone reductase-like Zn-dependent oxidoreductase